MKKTTNNNNNNNNCNVMVNSCPVIETGIEQKMVTPLKPNVTYEDDGDIVNIGIKPNYCDVAGTVLQVGDALMNQTMATSKKAVDKQVELFEKNLDHNHSLRFVESQTGSVEQGVERGLNEEGKGNAAPVALRQALSNAVPVFLESNPGTVRIQHREMVTALTGAATEDFSTSFRIQPANNITFPWLSRIANMFESYTFHMLRILFVPRVPTSTAGQVGLALDFDADDSPATTLVEFSQYQHSVIGSVWAALALTVEGEALQKCVRERYTDHGIGPHPFDPILHDVANLRVAILTTPVEVLGQIYIEYDITLRTPEPMPTTAFANAPETDFKTGVSGGSAIGGDGPASYTPYGQEDPSMTVSRMDIPVDLAYSPIRNGYMMRINQPGRFLVYVVYRFPISTLFNDVTKAIANTKGSSSLVTTGAGITINTTFPLTNVGLAEISLTSQDVYMHVGAVLDITVEGSRHYFYFKYTPAVGADIVAAQGAVYTYNTIIQIEHAGMPALKSGRFPTLTKQQITHPLGGTHLLAGKDSRSRRAIIDLAQAMKVPNLPTIKKLRIKKPKVQSAKRNKKKPNSKK